VGERTNGKAHFAAQDRAAGVDLIDARQHIGHQIAVGIGGGVAGLGQLIIGGTVDIVEHRPRQALLGQQPEVVDVMAIG
jgi:F0F1-type ATP synthase membrane subunit c/vacuolar-type H+-ATPase subunit K